MQVEIQVSGQIYAIILPIWNTLATRAVQHAIPKMGEAMLKKAQDEIKTTPHRTYMGERFRGEMTREALAADLVFIHTHEKTWRIMPRSSLGSIIMRRWTSECYTYMTPRMQRFFASQDPPIFFPSDKVFYDPPELIFSRTAQARRTRNVTILVMAIVREIRRQVAAARAAPRI